MALFLNVLSCAFASLAAIFWYRAATVFVTPVEAVAQFKREYKLKHGVESQWEPSQIIDTDSSGREIDLSGTLKKQGTWNARAAWCACAAAIFQVAILVNALLTDSSAPSS